MTADTPRRQCTSCRQRVPLTAFRRNRRGAIIQPCQACNEAPSRARRQNISIEPAAEQYRTRTVAPEPVVRSPLRQKLYERHMSEVDRLAKEIGL